jgi:hypothetical protein
MAYILPAFNNSANLWINPGSNACPTGMPDATIACNIALGKRANIGEYEELVMWLLMPAATNIHGRNQCAGNLYGDIVEAPANTGKTYRVLDVNDAGQGFPNEHRIAIIQQTCYWPDPIPGGSPLPPPAPGIISVNSQLVGPLMSGGFGTIVENITMPARGLFVLVITCYEPGASGLDPIVKMDQMTTGTPVTPVPMRLLVPPIAHSGVNCTMAVFSTPVGMDTYRISMVQNPGNNVMFQIQMYVVTGIAGNMFTTDSQVINGSSPSITASTINVSVPAIYLATFTIIDPGTGTGWAAPFGSAAVDVSATYLGFTCIQTSAAFVSGVLSLPTAALGIASVGRAGLTLVGMQ